MSPVQRQRPGGDSHLVRRPEPINTGAAAPAAAQLPSATRQTPRRLGVQTSEPEAPRRTAFTWRLAQDEAVLLDGLALRLRGDLGHRLDRATWLIALCRLAADDPAIYAALRAELEDA
ncbi:MAG: hypothetical protein ACRDNF_25640 [Streptosporangiaceae bacterium]